MNLETYVYSSIQRQRMLQEGDCVVVGVSGGADSICLLRVLCQLREQLQLELRAVHVHHGLRESADKDADYTAVCCKDWNVPLTMVHVRVREEAKKRGCSVEEAGRDLRYAALRRELQSWKQETGRPIPNTMNAAGATRKAKLHPEEPQEDLLQRPGNLPGMHIAVAHHREDCAETVLFNLSRGSSLAGLGGIRGVQGDIIRPLIDCSRAEIEAYLQKENIPWCTDETNADDSYTRNYIRRHVLPALELGVNSRAAEHIGKTAADLQEAEDYLQQETQRALLSCRIGICPEQPESGYGTVSYSKNKLAALHPYLKRRVLYAILQEAAQGAKDLTRTHVEELEQLLRCGGTGGVDLPLGLRAIVSYDCLNIRCEKDSGSALDGRRGMWPMRREDYHARILPFEGDLSAIPTDPCTKWLDYDKIGQFPTFRTREPGDRMSISKEHSKKLSRIMIDLKIPEPIRDKVVLPTAGQEILWLPGYRIAARYLVGTETRNILELHIERPEMTARRT